MNGPFSVSHYNRDTIEDANGKVVARGQSEDGNEEAERANAEMVCAALNAVFYARRATEGAA